MEPRSSSEIHSRAAMLSLGSLAVAASALLALSPLLAVALCPLVFGVTDFAAAALLGAPGPSPRVRIVARGLASATWGGALSTIVAARGAEMTGVRLPLLSIALAVGTVIGVFGTGGQRARGDVPATPPLAQAPLLGVFDVLTTVWVLVNAIAAHGADLRARTMVWIAIAVSLVLRALVCARIAMRDNGSAALAAGGFVAWIAIAAIACTRAATPMTWSGLGAALVLTLAAALAESRKRRALPVFLRGSLAFMFAAMLGVATFLAA